MAGRQGRGVVRFGGVPASVKQDQEDEDGEHSRLARRYVYELPYSLASRRVYGVSKRLGHANGIVKDEVLWEVTQGDNIQQVNDELRVCCTP
ncbi:hypothetical protein L1987_33296 [Smallanthus sonchifolius]|uniref:Uncharacterized protein n=1 Tax=Smallanthus sonchifolius TaxID=185202 RepID=A0ACB9HQN5_9ASTR|nr:hypothetical protein L1987_33296 [Smallanthus sonchifolius]